MDKALVCSLKYRLKFNINFTGYKLQLVLYIEKIMYKEIVVINRSDEVDFTKNVIELIVDGW